MKIIIAPDSFKESLTAPDVANAIQEGLQRRLPDAQYIKMPIADGGEGTLDTLVNGYGGQIVTRDVMGPQGKPVSASFGVLNNEETAVIEMATASGLELTTPDERNPLTSTTYGTGELIRAALDKGVNKIIIGLGGSATNDGGAGMMSALGARFLDRQGKTLPVGGAALAEIDSIDLSGLDHRIAQTEFIVACDVANPLTGDNGASAVFGPQKGASPEQVTLLDQALVCYSRVIESTTGIAVDRLPGAGAAGGMGAALVAFMNATLKPGIKLVLDLVKFDSVVQDADLVITGEGRMDAQSIQGKAPVGVALAAKVYNVPVIALAGCLGDGVNSVYDHGIDAVFSVCQGPVTLQEALDTGYDNLVKTSEAIARTLTIKHNIHSLEGLG